MWTKSACVVLAWGLPLILMAVGMGTVRPAQANIRSAGSTTELTLTSTPRAVTAPVTPPSPTARYVVRPGDTLSGIAAAFSVRGGLQALYTANRRAIGPDPNTIQPGTVLQVPGPVSPAPRSASQGRRLHIALPPAVTGGRHRPTAPRTRVTAATGMPRWLKTVLLAAGLLITAALIAGPVLLIGRRRRRAAAAAARRNRIVMADYDRLVVTHCKADDTVYVLRPPAEDPKAILRVARLVLTEEPYEELAGHLGVSANWPLE